MFNDPFDVNSHHPKRLPCSVAQTFYAKKFLVPSIITLQAHLFEGLHNSDRFSIYVPIDRYNTPYSYYPSRKKNEAKRKSITFNFNFTFIVEQTLSKTCHGTHYCSAKFPETTIFILFVGNIAQDF